MAALLRHINCRNYYYYYYIISLLCFESLKISQQMRLGHLGGSNRGSFLKRCFAQLLSWVVIVYCLLHRHVLLATDAWGTCWSGDRVNSANVTNTRTSVIHTLENARSDLVPGLGPYYSYGRYRNNVYGTVRVHPTFQINFYGHSDIGSDILRMKTKHDAHNLPLY